MGIFAKAVEKVRKNRAAVVGLTSGAMIPVFSLAASAEGSPSATTDYQTVISELTGVFTSQNIATVLAYAVGFAVAMVFTWWGARKVAGVIKRAFMRGKLRF